MRKLFFLAALGVAGFMSANNTLQYKVDTENSADKLEENTFISVRLPKQWITVNTLCGKTYYMQLGNYDTLDDFWEAQIYFNEIKCPGYY